MFFNHCIYLCIIKHIPVHKPLSFHNWPIFGKVIDASEMSLLEAAGFGEPGRRAKPMEPFW